MNQTIDFVVFAARLTLLDYRHMRRGSVKYLFQRVLVEIAERIPFMLSLVRANIYVPVFPNKGTKMIPFARFVFVFLFRFVEFVFRDEKQRMHDVRRRQINRRSMKR